MKRIQDAILIIACFCLIGGYAESRAATAATPLGKQPGQTAGKPGWQKKWEQTLEAAKKEGKVTVALTGGPEIKNVLQEPFEKKFGIKVEFTIGKGAEQAGKIAAERRAGLYLTDVYCLGNSTSVVVLKPSGWLAPIDPVLILPEVTDSKVWRNGKMPFIDKDHTVIGFLGAFLRLVLINSQMVNKKQIQSYQDLLKPEWKGKIVMDDASITGPGLDWVSLMYKIFDSDIGKLKSYLQQLAKQEPLLIQDRRLQVEWVARGKYPIGIGFHSEIGSQMKAAGAPIDVPFLKEGVLVSAASGSVCLPKGQLPHPNAAVVFINWLLTREGQTAFVKGYGNPSARLDVSTAGIDPVFLVRPGEKLFQSDEELLLAKDMLAKTVKDVFAGQFK